MHPSMRTRKRSIHAVQSPAPASSSATGPAEIKRAHLADPSCTQLRDLGFTIFKPMLQTSAALTIAAGALQAQLKLCSRQPQHDKFTGYTEFPRKQRLEHQIGSKALHDLPLLQHIIPTVGLRATCTDILVTRPIVSTHMSGHSLLLPAGYKGL